MRFNTFFFDLDETLYPSSAGLWMEIRQRINLFLKDQIGIPQDQIESLRDQYFKQYGTTLRGLQENHQVNMDEYLAFVHNIPIQDYLQPDPQLRTALLSIKGKKYIFTNADCAHANRVIKTLDLEGIFDGCIDVHVIYPHCKPMPGAFQLALAAAGNPDPRQCVLLDDQGRITRAARSMGMYTVLVGKDSPGFEADECLPRLADLPELMKNWRI